MPHTAGVSIVLQYSRIAPPDWFAWQPAVAVAIALAALVVSIWNRNTARRSLQLSEAQEARRAARLVVKVEENVTWRSADSGSRWIGVKVLASNPTDRDGAIIDAELLVTYRRADLRAVVRISQSPVGSARADIETMDLPARLLANGAIKGWLTYSFKEELLSGAAIEQYAVVLSDGRGIEEIIYPWVLKEISDDESA